MWLLYVGEQYEDALAALTLYGQPNADGHRLRAASLSRLERIDAAKNEMQALSFLRPKLTARHLRKNLGYLRDIEIYIDTLRQAALPE